MAEKVNIELEIKDNVKSLKAQLREAQNEVTQLSEKFGATSKEAINAAKRAAELKDAIADAKDLTDAFNPDAKFNALSNSIGGVLNGFQAFEGALGLIGVESEDLQETLLKVQSAMALSQGLQGALEAKDAFVQLGAVVKNSFANMTAASKAFAVTGIGLLLTAVGLVIANFDKLKEAFSTTTQAQKDLNSTIDAYKEGTKEAIKKTNEVGHAFQLARKGVMSKGEALKIYNDTLGDSFGKASSLNEAEKIFRDKTDAYIKATALRAQANALFSKAAEEQADALAATLEDQRNWAEENVGVVTDAVAGFIDYQTLGYTEFGKKADEVQGKIYKNAQNREKQAKQNRSKALEDLGKDLLLEAETIEKANAIKSETESAYNKEQQEKAKEARQKILEARREADIAEQAALNEFLAQKEATENEYLNKTLTNQELEVQAVNDKYFELLLRAKQYKQDTTLLEEARQKELDDINKKYLDKQKQDLKDAQQQQLDDQETFDELYRQNTTSAKQLEIDAVNEKYFYLIEQAKQYGYDIVELEKRRAAELAIIDASIYQHKEELRQNDIDMAIQAIGILRGVFEKDKNFQKAAIIAESALGVAKIIINTQAANAAALLTPQAIATSGAAAVPVIARNNISAGIGIAANIASTAKALQALGGGSAPSGSSSPAGGGGGGGANGTSTPANFNIVGNAGANPLAGLNQPIQAYVVSGQITSAQELDRKQISYSSFP